MRVKHKRDKGQIKKTKAKSHNEATAKTHTKKMRVNQKNACRPGPTSSHLTLNYAWQFVTKIRDTKIPWSAFQNWDAVVIYLIGIQF